MSACLLIAGAPLWLAGGLFTLTWTHSVERTAWQETWRVAPPLLHLETSRVKGSGAGMEPGPGARLEDGWWTWHATTALPALSLANSGATDGDWTFCADGRCRTLGQNLPPTIDLRPCTTP